MVLTNLTGLKGAYIMASLVNKITERMINIDQGNFQENCPISIIDINKWEWAQGVGLYGMYSYCKAFSDNKYMDYIKNWYEARIEEGLPEKNVNTCAPLLTLSYLYRGEPKYKAILLEWAQWLMTELPRTEEGGFVHMVSGHTCYDQLWDDTLFMCVLFLARAGIIFDRSDFLEETKRQFLIHLKYLTDTQTGLMFHGWTFAERNNGCGALWGRGNCWITIGIPEYIEIMGDKLEDGIKSFLISTLETQVCALEKYQDKDGMWHTLINDPSSYKETSATAGFAYGILKGIRTKCLDKKHLACAQRAVKAVEMQTDSNGTVGNVSYGTAFLNDLEYYKGIELCPMTYGQALAILCISESFNHK